jgi:hypothetical protein
MTVMEYNRRLDLEDLLASENPRDALRAVIERELQDNDVDRDRIYDALDDVRLRLSAAGREEDADVLADVMDCMVGWSAFSLRL